MRRDATSETHALACDAVSCDGCSAEACSAVQANPTPGCTATPAQLKANKKAVMEFFQTSGADRVALADVTYKQHNPVFVKARRENHVSD